VWPTQPYRPALERSRAPLAILLVSAGLVLAVAAGAIWSIRSAHPITSAYSTGEQGAQLWVSDAQGAFSAEAVPRPGPGSNDAELAYDPSTRTDLLWDHGCSRLVLGFTGGCTDSVNATWTWAGGSWQRQPGAGAPVQSGSGALFYDPQAGHLVYASGAGSLWQWTGSAWAGLALPGGPGVHAGSLVAAGFDLDRGLLVLVLRSATWSFDGARWTSVPSAPDGSDLRPDAKLVDDRAGRQLVYLGRRFSWSWDGAGWTPQEQPPLEVAAAVFDPVRGAVVLVQEDSTACDRATCGTTLWTRTGSGWSRADSRAAPRLPVARSSAADPPIAFDEARGAILLFVSSA